MAYSKQTWDTTSYVNPTRMNHIEQGIYDATTELDLMDISSDCVGVEFGVFPVSFSYGGTTHNVNVFGIKMKQNNSRNVILGMIQGGSDLPYRFIANTSWNNKTCLINPTD